MPQIYDMGPTVLLPLRRKACCGFFASSAGFEPVDLGTKGQHATSRPSKSLRQRDTIRLRKPLHLTKYNMAQGTSWAAASSFRILRNHKFYHCDHKSLQLVPELSQMNPISVWSTLKVSGQLHLRARHDLFYFFSPTNPCMQFSNPPSVPHAQPLSSCLILSSE